jgi:hypothetical protein
MSVAQSRIPDVLTMNEVAGILRVSKAHVCNLVYGKIRGVPPLPHMSLGRRIVINRASLEEWMKSSENITADDIRLGIRPSKRGPARKNNG